MCMRYKKKRERLKLGNCTGGGLREKLNYYSSKLQVESFSIP